MPNFANFRNDWAKTMDFSIKAYFWVSLKFGVTYCNFNKKSKKERTITNKIRTFTSDGT